MICDWVDLSHVIVSYILAPSKTSCPPPVIIFLCRIKVYKCNWTSTWIFSGQFQCIAIHVLDTLDDFYCTDVATSSFWTLLYPHHMGPYDTTILTLIFLCSLYPWKSEYQITGNVGCQVLLEAASLYPKYAAYSYWLVTSFSIPGNWYSCLVEMCNQVELFFMSSFTVSIIYQFWYALSVQEMLRFCNTMLVAHCHLFVSVLRAFSVTVVLIA